MGTVYTAPEGACPKKCCADCFIRARCAVMISATDIESTRSSYSGSPSSIGGRGVDVPVRSGVEVPDTEGVAGAVGSLGTIVVMLNATSPESVAWGFALYFASSISIPSNLSLAEP